MCNKRRIWGSADRPRLVINKSNTAMSCQLINDDEKKVLAYCSSREKGKKNCNVNGAQKVGEEMGEKMKSLGIEHVVFDRCHHIFHGKVKALVDGVLSKIDK